MESTTAAVLNAPLPETPRNSRAPKTAREKTAAVVFRAFRIFVVLNVTALFFPQLNPARISELINRSLSLFTCAISYSSISGNLGRAISRGWVTEASLRVLNLYCIVVVVGVALMAAGACVSLGNNPLKKLGALLSFVGGGAQFGGLVGILYVYNFFTRLENSHRITPMLPPVIYFYFAMAAVAVLFSIATFLLIPRSPKGTGFKIETKFQLFLMILPFLALAFVFAYLPLYGWRYAFFDYEAGGTLTRESFVGFKWFTMLFQNAATRRDIITVMRNTFAMSGLGILTSWVPLAFAVFLSEVKNSKFRRLVQTFTTIPNFISWVLVYAVAIAIFASDGFVNSIINQFGGEASHNYLMDSTHMWSRMLAWGMWKGLGWSAIIYIASISSIDPCLYEAATIDGAGRFGKMWYITVPSLFPTFCVLLLLAIANVLSNGLEQYLVFSNPLNRNALRVLDLYVYDLGIGSGLIPLSTVIGMFKTVFSVTLLLIANRVSKILRGESIV